jgi:signal transduction histidine kinase
MLAEIMEPKSQQIPPHHAQQLETLGLMTSGIVHDFNNLLASIVGQTSLALAKMPVGDAARPHVEKVMKAAEYATALTHQLLTYASGDPSRLETIDLNQLIRDNVNLLNLVFLESVTLQLELAPQLPAIEVKRAHLQQVVMNLVINAAEATRGCAGLVTIRTGRQTLLPGGNTYRFLKGRSPMPGEYVYIQVSDTGIGIDEATLTRIFDPFFTTKVHGKGLGLSTILNIVNLYKGGIAVESTLGCGATFTVFFPNQYNERLHQHSAH